MKTNWNALIAGIMAMSSLVACTHTIKVEPSDKPIVININLNIQQEIRVRLDKDIEDILTNNPDVF